MKAFTEHLFENSIGETNLRDATSLSRLPSRYGDLIRGGYKHILNIPSKKLFDVSGKEFDMLNPTILNFLQSRGRNISLTNSLYKSNTYSNFKEQVICSMTGQLLKNNRKILNEIFGKKDVINPHIKSMSSGTKNVVRYTIEKGVDTFKKIIPKMKYGKYYTGVLGTKIFKGGSHSDQIVPWLLTVGAILLKKINNTMYKKTSKRGRKLVNPYKN